MSCTLLRMVPSRRERCRHSSLAHLLRCPSFAASASCHACLRPPCSAPTTCSLGRADPLHLYLTSSRVSHACCGMPTMWCRDSVPPQTRVLWPVAVPCGHRGDQALFV